MHEPTIQPLFSLELEKNQTGACNCLACDRSDGSAACLGKRSPQSAAWHMGAENVVLILTMSYQTMFPCLVKTHGIFMKFLQVAFVSLT